MQCPRCDHPDMQQLAFGRQTVVEWCGKCGGAWYERDELERALGLEESVSVAAEGGSLRPGVTCPVDHTPTAEVSWPRSGTVRIDACTRCGGRWLDRGELEAVRDELRKTGRLQLFDVGEIDGKRVAIPVADVNQVAASLQWRWVGLGAVIILSIYGFALGVMQFSALFDALADADRNPLTTAMMAAASLVAFPVGGAVIGRGSSGFTVWEAALAALPAAVVMGLVSSGQLSLPLVAGLMVAGFVLALLGAAAGERLSAT